MQLTLNSEQAQLRDAIARFIAERYPDSRRRDHADSAEGFGRDAWAQMAGLGWLGAGLSEEEGGYGGGPVEVMVIMEAAGRGLMQEPLLPVMVHSARLLLAAGRGPDAVAGILSGDEIVVVAVDEPGLNGARQATRIEAGGEGYVLAGAKRLVPFGHVADAFLVSCTFQGRPAVVRVPASATGIDAVAYRTIDGRRAADLTFDGVIVPAVDLVATGDAAAGALALAEQHAMAALCAEAVGVAQFLHDTTLDYVRTREQFGQAIGRFQAVQHRMADMFATLEEARSLAVMATVKLASSGPAERAHSVSAAKIGVLARAMHVAREAIQLHGGVGMTEDLPIGAGFRRLKALSLAFGDENHHLDRMAPGIAAGVYA